MLALVDELKEGRFEYEYRCDTTGHIIHLFFAHPISIPLTRTYPAVLLMDCTYKTNRFRMPLLDVVGMTSFNTTFFSCFAFLKSEEKEDYEWALTRVARLFDGIETPNVIVTDRELVLTNALETTFPDTQHLLCVWHVEKNVLSHFKRLFTEGEQWDEFLQQWTTAVNSKTEEDFNVQWQVLCARSEDKPSIIACLQDT